MNKRPVSYLQTDKRWKAVRLPCVDGSMSIGGGGCGPTSAAMLIETLTGKTCTPVETFAWCCEHGFVFAGQGTSYYAFRPLFKSYGIDCEMVDIKCLSATSPVRPIVIERLKQGYYLIALMKKGLWTKNGHYIVVWWADDKIRINDPASTKNERLNGDPDTFFSQAKYFWLVDARKCNRSEDLDMTKQDFSPHSRQRRLRRLQTLRDSTRLSSRPQSGQRQSAARRPPVHCLRMPTETACLMRRRLS